jgi:hypothetical protein
LCGAESSRNTLPGLFASALAVRFEGWFVAVNLGETAIAGEALGQTVRLPPLGVTVSK